MHMKKRIGIVLILMMILSIFGIDNTYAAAKQKVRISDTLGLKLRSSATSYENNKLITVPYNTILTIIEEVNAGNGCSKSWYKVTYESYTGYICSTYTEKVNVETNVTIKFGDYKLVMPDTYEYEIVQNKSVALENEDATIDMYVEPMSNVKFADIKANKDAMVTTTTIDDVSITLTSATIKTINNQEYVLLKGTAKQNNNNYQVDYYITSKNGLPDVIAILILYQSNKTENDGVKELEKIMNNLSYEKNLSANEMSQMTDAQFEQYLTSQGFPESYKVKLREIHKKHPSWIFIGTNTGKSWSTAMYLQDEFAQDGNDSSPGNSFLNINPNKAAQGLEGYLSTQPNDYDYYTNKFKAHDGLYWFQANSAAIAHYMDPRYYLTEHGIFSFQDLSYDSSYQTVELVRQVLGNNHLTQFAPYFVEAAQQNKTSPIYLAALARQEVGTTSTNICSNGQAGVLSDGVDYTGYYNFYNIGASSSSDPKLKSLQYAKSAGWNSAQKAIVNGAYKISVNYIQCGQHTLYYQKYNFNPKATKGIWHQYTTNIDSLESQSSSTFNSYKNMGVSELPFKFDIPIFSNMPESTPLPKLGNPNNYLRYIKVNGVNVTNFDGAVTKYTVNIPYTESIAIDAQLVAFTSSITGLGTFEMKQDTVVRKIVVTSANGIPKEYELTIVRTPKPVEPTTQEPTVPDRPLDNNTDENNNNNTTPVNNEEPTTPAPTPISVTNVINSSSYKTDNTYLWNITYGTDVNALINNLKKYNNTVSITIKDKNGNNKSNGTVFTNDKVIIETGTETKTYTVVQYGDSNGDGKITALDLLNVQKILLKQSTLSGAYYKAMDTNKDGKITAIDLLNVQKHILKVSNISQG